MAGRRRNNDKDTAPVGINMYHAAFDLFPRRQHKEHSVLALFPRCDSHFRTTSRSPAHRSCNANGRWSPLPFRGGPTAPWLRAEQRNLNSTQIRLESGQMPFGDVGLNSQGSIFPAPSSSLSLSYHSKYRCVLDETSWCHHSMRRKHPSTV